MLLVVFLVLLFWTLWFAGPYIKRWLMRRSVNYMQNQFARSMGIDPNLFKDAQQGASGRTQGRKQRGRTRRGSAGSRRKIIPSDYGEAVSFEVLTITGEEKWLIDADKSPVFMEYKREVQISDVQYVKL